MFYRGNFEIFKFSKSVISRSNSLKIFPMKLFQVYIPSESTDLQMENASLSRGLLDLFVIYKNIV
jgi:hypothetical protein